MITIEEKRRELFEAWHCERFKTKYSNGQPTRDMHNGVYAECYTVQIEQDRWLAFSAALDAVVIELPTERSLSASDDPWYVRELCIGAIESTGLGLKVKS